MSQLNATDSVEAIDDFLLKFVNNRGGLPERTKTPVLRINTPEVNPAAVNQVRPGGVAWRVVAVACQLACAF